MSITEASVIHHVCIVLLLLWLLSSFNCCHPVAYFISLIYLYLVHEKYVMRLRRKVNFEERRQANQKRVLSDSETVRWLNHAIEKIWPVCMEQIFSQKILLPIIPWFLQKYKPWTVKDAMVQHLYLGRSPPMFTEMRVLRQSSGDDHLVLELGINFRTADDMNAILAVKLRKRLGLGISAKMHLMGMHVEGKVLVGVKFLCRWPFLGRLRVCFVEPPYFQMTVKPMFSHGLDVTELPGIAGWLDKLLAIAFEQTLVEPNMLVVDMEKFASPQPENWFTVDAKEPIAHALVEIVEAADMKPSDLNGLADPYVKGQLGPYRFRTKTQRKTLSPKWREEFKIPISTWESTNMLIIEVHDKDHFVDDTLGDCSICINDLRDGRRHDMWLSLQNIKMGRLHLAVTVTATEGNGTGEDQPCDEETSKGELERDLVPSDTAKKDSIIPESSEKSSKVADKLEPIDIEGQRETGMWVHHPGSEVAQLCEPRKGKSRLLDSQVLGEGGDSMGSFKSLGSPSSNNDSSSNDESQEGSKMPSRVRRGLHKIRSVFHRSPRDEDKSSRIEEPVPSPHVNLRAVNEKDIGVKLIVEDDLSSPSSIETPNVERRESPEVSGPVSPNMAKSILKHAENSARGLNHTLSRRGSSISRGEPGSVLSETDVSTGSNSDEETLPSPACNAQVEANSVVPSPKLGSDSNYVKTKEHEVQASPVDPAMVIVSPTEKVSVEDTEWIGDDHPPGRSKGNSDGLVEK